MNRVSLMNFHRIRKVGFLPVLQRQCKPCDARGITLSCHFRREARGGTPTQTLVDHIDFPRLSRHQVKSIINHHAASFEVNKGAVKGFETNKLASNSPIEDRSSQGQLTIPNVETNQFLFGMYDGHGGSACAQMVSERLLNYISVMLSPLETLDHIYNGTVDPCSDLISTYQSKDIYHRSHNSQKKYKNSLMRLANEIISTHNEDATVEELLEGAFTRLDEDILADAHPAMNGGFDFDAISLAISGACANVAYINETDLYIANSGDCQAVLGVIRDNNEWEAVELSKLHDANNQDEVTRLQKQHPGESGNLLRGGRLLGDLAPLRAFGDARYKWPEELMSGILKMCDANSLSVYGTKLIPSNYRTPPYLTAEPQVTHHALCPRDKFLVLASDGLWEHLEPQVVVNLIAGHMDGKQVLMNDFNLQNRDVSLGEVNDILKVRKRHLLKKPIDDNVATHLMRMALGPEHAKLSHYLTLPENIVRNFRDDITITVIYFNTEYIRDTAFANV